MYCWSYLTETISYSSVLNSKDDCQRHTGFLIGIIHYCKFGHICEPWKQSSEAHILVNNVALITVSENIWWRRCANAWGKWRVKFGNFNNFYFYNITYFPYRGCRNLIINTCSSEFWQEWQKTHWPLRMPSSVLYNTEYLRECGRSLT